MHRHVGGAVLLAVGLAMAAGAGQAAKRRGPVEFRVEARIAVDAHGAATRVELPPEVAPALQALVRQRVAQWLFSTPKVNGVPAEAEASLHILLHAEPAEGGQYNVTVEEATVGPGIVRMEPPPYPHQMLREGQQATLLLVGVVQPDGSFADVAVESCLGPTQANARKTFVDAALHTARHWKFRPERVAGNPVSTRVRIPVNFRLAGRLPLRAEAGGTASATDAPESTLVAVDSPVALLSSPVD